MRNLIESWVNNDLSVVDKNTGFAPCPFAKKAIHDNKLNIIDCDGDLWEQIAIQCKDFDDKYSVVICTEWDPRQTYEEVEAACMAMNEWFALNKMDVWLLAFQTDFTMVFVQRLSELNEASQKLEKMGYYEHYDREDYVRLILNRRRRFQNAGS